jgi:carbonic anhydrase
MKPSAEQILEMLRLGNQRYCQGKSVHPHMGPERLDIAGRESQADHALVTILSCSDSRVPAELIFDLGIMDAFVVRVAGNVVNSDEIGCIEYGLCHVKTPLLVLMGHTQCGAVTAATQMALGRTLNLEQNILPLVSSINPAVQKALQDNPGLSDQKEIVEKAAVENLWHGLENLLRRSADVRKLLESGQVKVAPAIYEVHSGRVNWLDGNLTAAVIKKVAGDTAK